MYPCTHIFLGLPTFPGPYLGPEAWIPYAFTSHQLPFSPISTAGFSDRGVRIQAHFSQGPHQHLNLNHLPPEKEDLLLVLQVCFQIFVYAKCAFIFPKA